MEIVAPPHWRSIDFISDLHLHSSEPATLELLSGYLDRTTANALFILGDLFEVWVGDDILLDAKSHESQVAALIRRASERMDIFIMHGNRDFLMGSELMAACNSQLVDDPSVLEFGQERWLLTHGDALCLEDHAYQQFRSVVRGDDWQREFLSKPLSERQSIVCGLRAKSEAIKRTAVAYVDVDETAAMHWLESNKARHMIHGHTHHPRTHALGLLSQRWVLSDWDGAASPPRFEVLRMTLTDQGAVQVSRGTGVS
jgi:UDP-2,3-diacylglucosamine hydrolase